MVLMRQHPSSFQVIQIGRNLNARRMTGVTEDSHGEDPLSAATPYCMSFPGRDSGGRRKHRREYIAWAPGERAFHVRSLG